MTRTRPGLLSRTPHHVSAAALAAALVLGLGACGGDDPATAGDEPSASASPSEPAADQSTEASEPTEATEATEATEEPSPTEAASPTVAPAAGLEVTEETSALNVPEGWTATEPLVDFASGAIGDQSYYDSVQLTDRPSLDPTATLDEQAAAQTDVLSSGATVERLADIELAGTPAYVLRWTEKGVAVVNFAISTTRNGRTVAIDVAIDDKTLNKEPQLLDSVLASFRWLD